VEVSSRVRCGQAVWEKYVLQHRSTCDPYKFREGGGEDGALLGSERAVNRQCGKIAPFKIMQPGMYSLVRASSNGEQESRRKYAVPGSPEIRKWKVSEMFSNLYSKRTD
jgi:hypothetical protein